MGNKHYINLTLLSLIPLLATAATPPSPPPSPAASPPPPPNITNILQKADEFTRFIGLLRSTHVADRLETQLDPTKTNNNNQASSSFGLTLFAPNDNAFSGLKSGALNSLSYDQMAKLVLFHCVPSFLSFSDLKAAVNPIRTEAGDVGPGQYPLNVTAFGTQVNFSTGVDRDHVVSVSSTVYSNSTQRLAIYEVDRLLAPMAVFPISPFEDYKAPAPAPAPGSGLKHKKKDDGGGDDDGVAPVADGGSSNVGGGGGSRSVRASPSGSARIYYYYYNNYVVFGVFMILICL